MLRVSGIHRLTISPNLRIHAPLISSKKCLFSGAIIPLLSGPVAQLVEQRIENPRVSGSIPLQATMYKA